MGGVSLGLAAGFVFSRPADDEGIDILIIWQ